MSNFTPANREFESIAEFELTLLKEEYFFIQNTIEDYNRQIWVIKALGITGTGAAIALTLQEKQGLIALLGCAIPAFFWVLEGQWKHFQRGFYPRAAELERILVTEYNLRGPAIFGDWSRVFKRTNKPKRNGLLWDGILNPSVFISYVLEIGFLLMLSIVKLR
ncbi:MAG TPA: hypothetical protein DCZ55_36490 [Cyanobacteria bacterium UBA11371]|nr:hypothetical protein [Cyanobacteria bacterium UBA11371]HBE31469.1 hypothetical protein [Cyanobacteria bacterium UBA11368]